MYLTPAKRDGKRFLNPVPTSVGGFSLFFKVAPRFLFGSAARVPTQRLGPFRTDPTIYANSPRSGLRVTWFGHSSSLVEIDGVRVLIDPVWDERAAPTRWTGPKRFFAPTLALEKLPPLDAVLISHDHYDHLGAATIRRLAQLECTRDSRWITSARVGEILRRLGIRSERCTELDWTERVEVGALTITALPARHFSGRGISDRFTTLWGSFALLGPQHRVYYGADSGEWEGFREIGEAFGPFDLTMLEIGAFDPLWADIHMGPDGAARMFQALGAGGLLMPIHWALFDLGLHHWKQPIEVLFAKDGLTLWSPMPGLPSEVRRGEELRSDWWRAVD